MRDASPEASLPPNTRRAYTGGAPPARRLGLDALGSTARRLQNATLAAYLAEFQDQGRAPGKRLDGGGRGGPPATANLADGVAAAG